MKLKTKTVEKQAYKLSLSENEAQELLENIVDTFYQLRMYCPSSYKNDNEIKARFPVLAKLADKIRNGQ